MCKFERKREKNKHDNLRHLAATTSVSTEKKSNSLTASGGAIPGLPDLFIPGGVEETQENLRTSGQFSLAAWAGWRV